MAKLVESFTLTIFYLLNACTKLLQFVCVGSIYQVLSTAIFFRQIAKAVVQKFQFYRRNDISEGPAVHCTDDHTICFGHITRPIFFLPPLVWLTKTVKYTCAVHRVITENSIHKKCQEIYTAWSETGQ